jgi:hypothetical protein
MIGKDAIYKKYPNVLNHLKLDDKGYKALVRKRWTSVGVDVGEEKMNPHPLADPAVR